MRSLQVRLGVHYYRRRLPRDVAKLVGRNEIVRSLKTTEPAVAVERAHAVDLALTRAVALLRETRPSDVVTSKALFRKWLDCRLTTDQAKANALPEPMMPAVRPRRPLPAVGARDVADVILAMSGFRLDPEGVAALAKGGLGNGQNEPTVLVSPRPEVMRLSKSMEMFLFEHSQSLRAKTRLDYDQTFRLAKDVWGEHRDVAAISKASARELKALLLKLPANMTQRFPGKTFQEAIELGTRTGLGSISPKTINKKLSNLSTFFGWLKDQGYVESNPFSGLAVRYVSSRRKRDPFTPKQLATIFSSGVFEAGHQSRPRGATWQDLENYWIPLIGMFTGMRLGEIAQLTTEDIRQVQDIWVFDVHDRAGNQLKTASSNRQVPVHHRLIDLGLLTYRDDVAAAGHHRLFPELEKASDGFESSAFSKRFARYLAKCGVKIDQRLTFHSFRHTIKDLMREAGVDRSLQDAICGHDDGSVQAGYGRGYSAAALSKALHALVFPVGAKLRPRRRRW